ncbi:PTS system, beta-glucoside-specific IIABC component [Williamsoniiplasma luminosum]|uniref:PTS system, beta-glucoside-specific IIABC component n=1 Tax=Williamsoniiplasma luminosum TaxID=214888 RepID=A0A2K8NX30_9MOLU|nr:glucose PTS transporter subunit IIA [Williamsoniiplasma luminosum]ATZ17301.1 PTS system, beta-glucoside-specific IIABC component [Williamsoniiplasma luminosum]
MKKIQIYSPVDGEIDLIENLNDGIFSEKMLGDGFFIKPKKSAFYSPIDHGKIALIADTKHAFFFEIEGVNVLMHIGLDTVGLDGKPFDLKTKLNQDVDLKTKIVDVDLDMIEKSGLSSVCPITIDGIDKTFEFKLLNQNKAVKQGDLIGEFLLVENQENIHEIQMSFREFFQGDNTYRKVGKQINKAVGGPENYTEVFNCMTRLRFRTIDTNKVDVDAIKKIPLVKGIIWNGNQLQIIIGQDVFRLKDAIILLNQNGSDEFLTKKPQSKGPVFFRFLSMFGNIMMPLIPVFIGLGMFQAVLGILSYDGLNLVPKDILNNKISPDSPIYWVVLWVMGRAATLFIGILIAYSAGKFFEFNRPMSIAIGLILCAPFMFGNGGPTMQGQQWILAQGDPLNTGILVIDGNMEHMGMAPINAYVIAPQNTKIFVIIAAIWLAKQVDSWVVKWIPSYIELTFRWVFVVGLVTIPTFFVFGPIWFYIEKVLGIGIHYISKAPIGLGVGFLFGIQMFFVLFGAHVVLMTIYSIDTMTHQGFSTFQEVGNLSVWAQWGATLGVAIVTRNAATRRDAISTAIPAIFGVAEPLLFAVNLPKRRPLYAGALASFVVGIMASLLGVTARVTTGIGILGIVGYFSNSSGFGFDGVTLGYLPGWLNGLYMLLCWIAAAGLAMGLTMLMYRERTSEKKQLIKNDKLFVKYLLTKKYINEQQAQDLLKNLVSISALISKEDASKIKSIEKQYQKIAKVQDNLAHVETQLILYKDKFILKGKKLMQKGKDKQAELLYGKYDVKPFEEKIAKLKIELKKISSEVDDRFVYDFQNNLKDKYLKIVNGMKKLNEMEKDKISRKYNSILNSLRIAYRLDEFDEAEINFAKEISEMEKANKLELKNQKIQVRT